MPAPNILVVVVDGLRASALGAYGNTSFPTPALDRFASESFLLDACYAPAPDLDAIYRALWLSVHPAHRPLRESHVASLPRLLATNGYHSALVTDDPSLASFAAAADFEQRVDVTSDLHSTARANDASETSLARLFSAACEAISSSSVRQPSLVWVHARGMYGPWDAPLEYQHSLRDEGDPPPIESIAPPDSTLENSANPDAAFQYSCAYAAQVMVFDSSWDGLLQAAASSAPSQPWLIMLLGARGFPLGEHSRIGGVDPRTYGEQLHVPWLVKSPDGLGRLSRSNRLASHVDLLASLVDSIGTGGQFDATIVDGMSVRALTLTSRSPWRDSLISASSAGHRAIRTDEWCLRQNPPSADDDSPRGELYVRPDDRWEANDVAKLCPDIVESLSRTLNDAIHKGSEPEAQAREL